MKNKVVNNKQLIMIIISILFVVIGTTFAWFTWKSTDNTNLVVNIGNIAEVVYTKGNDITASNIGPVLDYNDGEITTFTFANRSAINELTTYIYITPTTLPEELQEESFKVTLLKSNDNVTFTEVITDDFSDKEQNTEFLLIDDTVTKGRTYYKLIIYIDGNMLNPNTMMGQSFKATIRVDAELHLPTNVVLTSNIGKFERGPYTVSTECDHAESSFNPKTWTFEVANLTSLSNCSINFYPDPNEYPTLYEHIVSLWNETDGSNNIYKETHTLENNETYSEYRYEGTNNEVNNYVWFNNELWRIIGAFPGGIPSTLNSDGSLNIGNAAPSVNNTVKIIRNDAIGSFAWDKDNTNDFTTAEINTNVLNNLYLNSSTGTCNFFSTVTNVYCNFLQKGLKNVSNFIENVTWNLGGYSTNEVYPTDMYKYERGSTVYTDNPYLITGKVGLMYPSDYGYSVASDTCQNNTIFGSYGSCGSSGWLLKYGSEWTQTATTDNNTKVYYIETDAKLPYYHARSGYNARPVVYLKSDILVLNASDEDAGSKENPYIVSLSS